MKRVLLTGISGYLGSHCAVELLKQGYIVRGSIRSLAKKEEVIRGITQVVDPENRLEFCQLDLLADEGWEQALDSCDYLLHVASPFDIAEPKDENDMIKPAVEGSLRALKFAKATGVKKVVVTSSTVAMAGDRKVQTLNQESWTDPAKDNVSAYIKSKALSEKAVWDFYTSQEKENFLEVTVINPGPIYGPTITGNVTGASMSFFKQMIEGKMPMVPDCSYPMSDVRDVATLHVKALSNDKTNGKRFIATTEKSYHFADIARLLKSYGFSKASPKVAPTFLLKLLSFFDSEVKGMRAFLGARIEADTDPTRKTFDWKAIDFEKTVKDTADSIAMQMK